MNLDDTVENERLFWQLNLQHFVITCNMFNKWAVKEIDRYDAAASDQKCELRIFKCSLVLLLTYLIILLRDEP